MSSRSRSYSREYQSNYSRSSSFDNKRTSSSSFRRRPLSSLLLDRDISPPRSFDFDRLDDPFFFDRRSRRFLDDFDRKLRWRFEDDREDEEEEKFFGNSSFDFDRSIPIRFRQTNTSTTRTVPVQFANNQRERVYRKLDQNDNYASDAFNNQSFRRNENRISSNDWPRQEAPTRKRTSMTIFLRQPRVQYSDVPDYQRTGSSSGQSSTYRTN